MQKIGENNLKTSLTDTQVFGKMQTSLDSMKQKVSYTISRLIIQSGAIYMLVGFLLGRAYILGQIVPFALPFFAIVFLLRKKRAMVTALSIVAGAFSLNEIEGLTVIASLACFILLNVIFRRNARRHLGSLPLQVLLSTVLGGMIVTFAYTFKLQVLELTFITVEGALGFILTIIFMQSVPFLSLEKRKQPLRAEEMICLVIMIASTLTGLSGVIVGDVSFEHILSRYFVLSFAFIGGASTGAITGVITGLIISLANTASLTQMSLLAFTGVLSGMLKEGKKIGTSIGLIIATVLLGLYGGNPNAAMVTVLESLIAVALFLLTPNSVYTRVSSAIPGSKENDREQQQYVRKLRDVTSQRVEQFADVFLALSTSFANQARTDEKDLGQREIDLFLSKITEKTCQTCFRKDQCWKFQFEQTYDHLTNIMDHVKNEDSVHFKHTRKYKEWENYCIKSKKVVESIEEQYIYYQAGEQVKRQVLESRKLVAEQLLGVAHVMEDFSKEIKKERENHYQQEDQIYDVLQQFGVELQQVEIYSIAPGSVDIELSIPYCNGSGQAEKIIAPMLSDILNETIIVKREVCSETPTGYCHVVLGSAKQFVLDVGFATAAKGGGFISGDSFTVLEVSANKQAIAISDGMGNGERAHYESNDTLKLLQKILKSGIEEKIAIKSINSILSLRSTDEIFSTLDLAIIDLQTASAKFLKVGSSPSFIKRGNRLIKVSSNNLPIGIIDNFDVDVVSETLKAGDVLIMMSDGVFEGPKHIENHEAWMRRKIADIQTTNPQEIADIILEEVIRTSKGSIDDDMTVVVSKIEHNLPKWSSIPVYSNVAQGG